MSMAAEPTPTHGFFASRDGLQLYHELWLAEPKPARASALFVHGYGEHCGRYAWPIEYLRARAVDCMAVDYRGHGQAGGARGHCYHFEEYTFDLEAALDLLARQAAGRPRFVIAHSHGALVALRTLLARPELMTPLRGLALSSPFLGLKMRPPLLKVAAARMVSRAMPRLTMKSGIPPEHLSHEPSVAQAYKTDRWVHDVATVRWFTEAMAAADYCLAHASALDLPLLVQLAGDDRIADAARSRALYEAVPRKDKRLIEYPGFFHEIFNEVGRAQVFADLERWLGERLA
jgi:alpha-beta hydrolase superfamily lysophospholipase